MQVEGFIFVDQPLQVHIFNTSGPVRLCIATHPQCLGGEVPRMSVVDMDGKMSDPAGGRL